MRESEPQVLELAVTENEDGTLHLVASGEDLTVASDQEGRILFERGFRWEPRADDPYNR